MGVVDGLAGLASDDLCCKPLTAILKDGTAKSYHENNIINRLVKIWYNIAIACT